MSTQAPTPVVRRLARALAPVPAVLVLLSAAPAAADVPATWPQSEPVSQLEALLLIIGAPLALIVVIGLLVYAPSLARGEKYRPGLAWRNENEWFGGPRGGVEAAERKEPVAVEAGEERGGGASARW